VVEETRPGAALPADFCIPSGHPVAASGQRARTGKSRLYRKKVAELHRRRKPPQPGDTPVKLPPFGAFWLVLRKYRLLPAIFFLNPAPIAIMPLQLCAGEPSRTPTRHGRCNQRMAELADRFPHVRRHRQRWSAEHLAIGSHHSGQLPAWKQVLET
jgi:ATP-dependent RNA helicase HelY